MTALLLLMLIQDRPVEASIEAFLKGDAGARTELLKLGAFAIRPLQKARDKSPGKIDPLVYELKKAAAYPQGSSAAATLDEKIVLRIKDAAFPEMMPSLLEWTGLPLFFDQLEGAGVRSAKVTLGMEDGPKRDLLDQICRQTGLDYGFFHNAIVISRPDRLWPAGPPPKARELRIEEAATARALVEKLNDDSIEAREAASRDLLKLGPSVIPVLEANLKRKEPEIAARCSALIERLRTIPRGAFGPPEALREKTSGMVDEETLKTLQRMRVNLDFQNCTMEIVAAYLKEFSGIEFEFKGEAGKNALTIRCRDQNLGDLLALITQSRDLDFVIRESKVLIGARADIEKPKPGGK
jgi:hypothetical protein